MSDTHKAQIIAKTEKGKEVMKTEGNPNKLSKAALKVCGYKQEILSEDPYTVEISLSRIPGPVFEQVIFQLENKFQELGAEKDKDYSIEVK